MTNLIFSLEALTGGLSVVPVVAIREWKEYTSDSTKSGKILGLTYEILLVHSAMEKVRVHVSDLTPIATQEDIEKHNSSLSLIMIRLEGFQAKMFSNNGQMQISAKADKAILVNSNPGTGAVK